MVEEEEEDREVELGGAHQGEREAEDKCKKIQIETEKLQSHTFHCSRIPRGRARRKTF